MRRVAILALSASTSCTLGDAPLAGLLLQEYAVPDAGSDAEPVPEDAGDTCAVDEDEDGSCAGDDCDDDNPRRYPGRLEYCPDRIDNDCDENVDFADECGAINDSCDGPLAILRQEEDRDQTYWQFDLPLEHYADDAAAGLSAGGGDCIATSGQNGRDAFFQLVAAADAAVEVTASGSGGATPVLVLQLSECGRGDLADVCDVADTQAARVQAALDEDASAWLVVDDAAATLAGAIRIEVRISRRIPH